MPPIHTAGVIVAHRAHGMWKVLLLRVYKNWDFPKGVPNAGEDWLASARRELQEETGIDAGALAWHHLEPFTTAPYKSTHDGRRVDKLCHLYLAETPTQPACKLSPEHHGYGWYPVDRARGMVVARLQAALDWARANLPP